MAFINHTRSCAKDGGGEKRRSVAYDTLAAVIRLSARPAFPLGAEQLAGGFGSRERRSQRADYSSAAGNNTP